MALALVEVLDDGGCGTLACDLLLFLRSCEPLAAGSPIEKEDPEAGCWMRCDFGKIVWLVVVLQLRKISIGYGVEEGWNC